MAGKHGWNELENYLVAVLRAVRDHPFVIEDDLDILSSPEAGEVSGDVFCHENVVLHVLKHYVVRTIDSRKEARTVRYAYHARYDRGSLILRYDNVHSHDGHPTPHHKHDYRSGHDEVTHVGRNWPHLSEILDELMGIVWLGR